MIYFSNQVFQSLEGDKHSQRFHSKGVKRCALYHVEVRLCMQCLMTHITWVYMILKFNLPTYSHDLKILLNYLPEQLSPLQFFSQQQVQYSSSRVPPFGQVISQSEQLSFLQYWSHVQLQFPSSRVPPFRQLRSQTARINNSGLLTTKMVTNFFLGCLTKCLFFI